MCVIPSRDCDKIPEAINFRREEVSIGRSMVGGSYRFELLARSRGAAKDSPCGRKRGRKNKATPSVTKDAPHGST